jgi:hypothetical protein
MIVQSIILYCIYCIVCRTKFKIKSKIGNLLEIV